MELTRESKTFQGLVGSMLMEPHREVTDFINPLVADGDPSLLIEYLSQIQRFMSDAMDVDVSGKPNLEMRLRFGWSTLWKADQCVKKHRNMYKGPVFQEDIRKIFSDLFPLESLDENLLLRVMALLKLDNAGLAATYDKVRNYNKPRKLPMPLKDRPENLVRLIWWLIRKNRDQYVTVTKDSDCLIHFAPLLHHLQTELPNWSNDVKSMDSGYITEKIEAVINWWLEYSCIDGNNTPTDPGRRASLAKQFIAINNLRNKVIVFGSPNSVVSDKRVKAIEAENQHYATENRRLEEELGKLLRELKDRKQTPDPPPSPAASAGPTDDLLVFLKAVDSKYSLDILRAIQLGDQRPLTLRSFVQHFFFSMRRIGVESFPAEDTFSLQYDDSALYECVGFEVEPGGERMVKVEQSGWAMRKETRLFPIRRAVLRAL